MSNNKVVRVGVGCFITSPTFPRSVLLGQRKGSHGAGKFAVPGGHLELGETWQQCAIREVAEETNLTINNVNLLHVTV
jgi:8-oxo-dGTP diphosphatase